MIEAHVDIVVTGPAWMGSGIGAIESALEKMIREATHEIMLSVYQMTGGADLVLTWLEAGLARGVQVKIMINRLEQQEVDVVSRLKHLATTYNHFYLYDFTPQDTTDLHAKVVLVDRTLALIGSSNLTRRGLYFNNELAVLLQGPSVAVVASALDRLFAHHFAVRVTG